MNRNTEFPKKILDYWNALGELQMAVDGGGMDIEYQMKYIAVCEKYGEEYDRHIFHTLAIEFDHDYDFRFDEDVQEEWGPDKYKTVMAHRETLCKMCYDCYNS